ncbi:exonuclease mut-7 homolog [Eucyclogobius newberryi]|uniref:exonuclease mut-7 homolog n=1 Tax=Eucyclogobius newberryi TaxID=166745 RepID=UPI003B59F6BB
MSLVHLDTGGLDPAVLRDQLFELWTQKDLKMLRLAALQGFSNLDDPLEAVLTILESCPGRQKGRSHTLGYHILLEFQTWMKEHPQVSLSSLPQQQTLSLQHRALRLLTDSQPNFVAAVIDIYQLNSMAPSVLRSQIIRLQALNSYKEAADIAIKLKLQNELSVEELCIPLILQDKLPMAESFVKGYKHLERALVTLLDSWCHPYFDVNQITTQFPRLSISRHHMGGIQPKMLSKHVIRLMEKFNIDQSLCPNALHKRRLDTLRYLMYKAFVEKEMTEENWSDFVQTVVSDDLELQIQLVEMLVRYSCLRKAAQWAIRYNIPRARLPCGVWETQQTLPQHLRHILLDSTQGEDWVPSPSHCERFYQVPLTRDRVIFVDTAEALQKYQTLLLKEGGVVGVDMEWQPTFGCNPTQQVALIQLAVSEQVFLIDLCEKSFCQHPDTIHFIRKLFSQPKILKLGYGMSGDLKCLLATWHQLIDQPLQMDGVLDLLNVHQKIQRSKKNRTQNGPKVVLVGEDSAEKGLSLLVQQVLRQPLDKTEQMSNWEKRPLRVSQIRYAVADAYCLLDVYKVLSSRPADFGLPADLRTISTIQTEKVKEKKQKNKVNSKEECHGAQRVSSPSSAAEKGLLCGEQSCADLPPVPPQQLRVVCDNMLQGLGRYLRCLGVDVVMLENTDDHKKAAELAHREGRFILTCGQPYQSLRSQVGEGRCLLLDCSEKARDQAVGVLRYFNIKPTPSDIFSRCQACNSDEYVAVPRADMINMLKRGGFLQDQDVNLSDQVLQQMEAEPSTSGATPALPRYTHQCRWASLSGLDPDSLTFPGGAPLQLHTVPHGLLPKIPVFYACTRCGKVFWDGSHFERVLSMFQDVFHITNPGTENATAAAAQ